MKNPLLDIQFLLELDKQKNKTTFARITALTPDERPVEQIEGRVTGGSINVDGASAVRRTSSVTLVGMDLVIHDVYWALEGKYQLEIGVLNEINPEYPNIIWFKQGIYLITQFSYSESTNNFSISISGKDKMAKLNGEMGGNVPAAHDFGQYEEVQKDGSIKLIKLPLYDIIRESVHQYGGEPFHNIIINDLDQFGYELWDYRGQTNDGKELPMYYFYSKTDNYKIYNVTVDGDMKVYKEGEANPITLSQIPDSDLYARSNIDEFNSTGATFTRPGGSTEYRIAKIEYGETAGYHPTALVYAGDLNIGAGEAITSLLDKIKNMLGEFEYFYDLDGKFVFQKKKTYVSGLFTPLNGETVDPLVTSLPYSYKFEDGELVTTYSNNPNIGNVKNDFIVWGNKKGIGGADIPIHARYAIDHKPEKYNSFPYYKRYYLTWAKFTKVTDEKAAGAKYCKDIFGNYSLQTTVDFNSGQVYYTCQESTSPLADGYLLYHIVDNIYYQTKDNKPTLNDENIDLYVKDEQTLKFALASIEDDRYPDEYYYEAAAANTYVSKSYSGDTTGYEIRDWRELIYLMARDFYQHNESIDYNLELARKNPQWYNGETKWTIPYGRTGYEQYYIDLQGFWRQIYDPEKPVEFKELYTSKDTLLDSLADKYLQIQSLGLTAENYNLIDDKRSIYFLYEKKPYSVIEGTETKEKSAFVSLLDAINLNPSSGFPSTVYGFNGSTYITYDSSTADQYLSRENMYCQTISEEGERVYIPLIEWIESQETEQLLPMIATGHTDTIYRFNQKNNTVVGLSDDIKKTFIDATSMRQWKAYSKDILGTNENNEVQYGYKEYSIPATFYEEVSPWMSGEGNYWSKTAYYQPEDLIFWFDFLDTYGELNQFSVPKIGDRTKVVNENTITSIYLKKTPDVQFKVFPTDKSQDTPTDFAYATIQIPDLLTGMFNISSQGIAASDKIDSLVYQHACCANSVTINTIPIYYLQPNTRIYAHSDLSKIDGDYIVSKISIPLTYNGTMSITATKVIKQLK